jgi:transcriptional regulator with XRE-family HTH domain
MGDILAMLVTNVNSFARCAGNSNAINYLMSKKLENWQLEDAARLRIFWDKKKPKSQAAFGGDTGIGTQGMVWQYLEGRRPLNFDALIKFADGLGVSARDISPTLWGKIESYFHSETTCDEKLLITEEQKKILDLADRMETKIRENWISSGEFLTLVPVLTPAEIAEVKTKRIKRKRGADFGPDSRQVGYGMGDTIRRGDYLTEDELKEKRKNNGNTI